MSHPYFYTKVDRRSRSEMVGFLLGHDRYHTMNGWNCQKSLSNCIKVHHLDLPADVQSVMWDAIQDEDLYTDISYVLTQFAQQYNWNYQIGHNGRSSGYLVLYRGTTKKLDYKSRCRKCFQLNYEKVPDYAEPWGKCGRCGAIARANLKEPIVQHGVSGEGYGGWEEEELMDKDCWDIDTLRSEVQFVKDFDRYCSMYVEAFVSYVRDCFVPVAAISA